MAGKLNALKVKALGPGMYLDDAGLYLVITPELGDVPSDVEKGSAGVAR